MLVHDDDGHREELLDEDVRRGSYHLTAPATSSQRFLLAPRFIAVARPSFLLQPLKRLKEREEYVEAPR